jgi:hypothetical protein
MPIPTECNEGKHFFVHGSEFCDRCDIDFDDWYKLVIEEIRKDTCIFLLSALESLIKEQVQAHALRKEIGIYIIDAVKDQARRKGWIDYQ